MGLGPGKGATPHIADAHGGRVGVGIRKPFPCLDGEQFGSVAGLHVMHMPVNVLMSGNGRVNPSESVWRKATIWFSSVSVKPSIPIVMSRLLGTSGSGQQFTFSTVPDGQCPEVTLNLNAATLRALDVGIWPSEVGANCVHSSFGLAQEPGPLRRKVPSPRSRKPKPKGFAVKPKKSGVL